MCLARTFLNNTAHGARDAYHHMADPQDITNLLHSAAGGDEAASARLFESVYEHLRRLALSNRKRWVGNDTMGTTALVNEAYLKLAGDQDYKSRAHFFATASKAMRQILVSYARAQHAEKRGGPAPLITLDDDAGPVAAVPEMLLDMERVMLELEADDPRRVRIVECRLFGGMSVEDTAAACDVSTATVKREWRVARAWLAQRMVAYEGN